MGALVPIALRILFAAHPELLSPVLQIIHRVIASFLIKQAGLKRSAADTAAVTLIQHFGSAANLNIHLHCLVLDGIDRTTEGEPVFQEARAPTTGELQGLLVKIIKRIMKLLTRTGHLIEEQGMTYLAKADGDSALTPLQAAACTYRIALGPRAGQKVLSLQTVLSRQANSTQPGCDYSVDARMLRAMRALFLALIAIGCGSKQPTPAPLPDLGPSASTPTNPTEPALPATPITAPAAKQRLSADTPMTTVDGNPFIAPVEWSVEVKGKATILEAPEGDSWIALIDVGTVSDAEAAIRDAWPAYPRHRELPVRAKLPVADRDGWTDQLRIAYQTSPNEKRFVSAGAMKHGDRWTVVVLDVGQAVAEKRAAATALIFGRLLPKGYERETFAGKKAHELDAARIKELGGFVERAQQALGVPGVSIGLMQNGKVVFTGGFGVAELGKPKKVDADTLYIVASNTKSLTTLMLGKLVDENKLTWDTPVTKLLPQFKLGDPDTTSRVLVRHLVCACTGLPRQDLEWLLEFKTGTPEGALATLGTMQPTSKFGEMYQYSNPLAAAGGFVGGFVLFPKLELGAAYDQAMKTRVFDPLGMTATTFDFKRALRANHATAHGLDIDGKPATALMAANFSILQVRPASGAWSNVKDMLKYVQMELAKGVLPNGKRYVSEAVLDARKTPQVWIGKDNSYGMGLGVSTRWGTPVVSHGGSMIGYKTQMFWLPEHGVGAVVLTNSDPGGTLHGTFMRKLVEVLFDGKPEADNDLAVAAKAMQERIAAERKLLTVPPDKDAAGKLAAKYTNASLGDIVVTRKGDTATFDFGEWKSDVATRKNPDGTISFVTIVPGMTGLEFVVGASQKRTLTVRDAQHEYVFTEN